MRNIDKVNTALVRTPKSTCNDLSSWVETTEEDSARQSIYKNDKENAPDYRPDVKTAISNTPKKKEDNEKKAEDSKNDSWGSLSAFNDPSSRKSVYKRDSDSQLPTAKLDKINVVEAAVETISSDCTNLRTELSDGHPSLVQDLKAKKKYDFIIPNNVYFGDRDKAKPVVSDEKMSAENQPSIWDQIRKSFWAYLGYK